MAKNEHNDHPKYVTIFIWLGVMTAVEIGVAIPEYSAVLKAIFLIGLACAKAFLVANYFMHLKFEKRTLGVIVIIPFIICVFLVIMLMPDLTSKSRHEGLEKPAAEVVNTTQD